MKMKKNFYFIENFKTTYRSYFDPEFYFRIMMRNRSLILDVMSTDYQFFRSPEHTLYDRWFETCEDIENLNLFLFKPRPSSIIRDFIRCFAMKWQKGIEN